MPIEITMPRLSDTMEVGTVVKWNIKEGQKVKSGDVIADIETDKATMELQSFDEGVVARLVVPEGQSVKVGTLIAVLAGAGEDAGPAGGGQAGAGTAVRAAGTAEVKPAAAVGAAVAQPPSRAVHEVGAGPAHAPEDNGPSRVFASPLARKIAAESGVDLTRVEGTGPSGRITRRDVESALQGGSAFAGDALGGTPSGLPARQAAPTRAGAGLASPLRPASAPIVAAPVPAAAPGSLLVARRVALSNMRRTIAKRLVESKQSIPHYQVTVNVDMDAFVELRSQLNEQLAAQGVKLSVNDFLVRACGLAMHRHPFVNSRWVEENGEPSLEVLPDVNIGIAIALDEEKGGGLVVATIRNADRIGLRQISAESRRLSEKARTKGLTIEEMSDSTYTISNLGMFGVSEFTAIINPPNAAILAVGAAQEVPVVRNGQVVPGHVMAMTQSSDHRIVDGAMAARYLGTVRELLEKPATLLV